MPKDSTLIIKLGAMGDVLRTTTILNFLPAPVTWVTQRVSLPLLENARQIHELIAFDEAREKLAGRSFDLAACLDDEPKACELLDAVQFRRHVGAFLEDGAVRYGESAAPWYDMGLLSRFGKDRADELKRLNTKPYQEYLFAMFGKQFHGEEYVTGLEPRAEPSRRIGIEMRADARWRWKRWVEYPALIDKLRQQGHDVFVFEQRDNLRDFIADVDSCGLVVTGDTLTMHVALALRKRTLAVFGPTSAPEIYDYGRLTKIVSPIDCICCYLRDCDVAPNCMERISLDYMLEKVNSVVRELE